MVTNHGLPYHRGDACLGWDRHATVMWRTVIGLLTVSIEKGLKRSGLNFNMVLLEWGAIALGFKLHWHQSNNKRSLWINYEKI